MSTFSSSPRVPVLHRLLGCAAAALLAVVSGQAGASQLSLPSVPLFVTASVPPNIMFMVDSSGSMANAVPDDPFNAAANYLSTSTPSTCTGSNLIPNGATIDLWVQSGVANATPMIRYSGNVYSWGTSGSNKCFAPTGVYNARLNVDTEGSPSTTSFSGKNWYDPATNGYLDAPFSGNYLNWYFNPVTLVGNPPVPASPAVTWNTSQRIKPVPTTYEPTGLTQSRIQIVRAVGVNLINGLDSRLRVGLSVYNGGDGGTLRVAVNDLSVSGQRTALTTNATTGIQALRAGGQTPLAETLSGIGRYFATGWAGALTMKPKNPPRTLTPTVAQAFPKNLTGAPATAPITQSCQQSFAVLMTDGRPSADQGESSYLAVSGTDPSGVMKDYDGDCYNRTPACALASGTTSSGPSPPFDMKPDIEGYEAAGSDYLDDVAQALYETDLRPDYPIEVVSGKQFINNVTTYMIGFADDDARNDPLIARTAAQGGGQFFAAANATALTNAFNDIITDIFERTGSFSAVALNSTSLNTNSRLFQASFNSADWSGKLSSIPISTGAGGLCPSVTTIGELCPESTGWNAASLLNAKAPASRVIMTYKPSTKAGTAFQWANLDASQQALLNYNYVNGSPATITVDTKGQQRLNYIRGDQSNEGTAAGQFRKRTGKLGDIADSDPFFVGQPSQAYAISGYSAFRTAKKNRTPMVYIGSNDGMLHGFRANDGQEIMAYVPNMQFGTATNPKLARLTSQPYTHVWQVDGSPTVGDVQIGATWRSYLVGGLKYGGQGMYALDVTDPENLSDPAYFSEANAANVVKWEFNDSNAGTEGKDLGYTFSQPAIAKMKNGKWAAIFGNGYNNREADGNVGSGRAGLFIVFVDGPGADAVWQAGTEFVYIPVGATPVAASLDNGLASASPVDIDGDGLVDYIYAGDLYGNMWQFNVNNANAATWAAGYGGNPLFTAKDYNNVALPITEAPEVGLNLLTNTDPDDLIVYFGTGRYIDANDNTQLSQQNQSFFAIYANPIATPAPLAETATSPNATRAQLLEQFILLETPSAAGVNTRITSNNTINIATQKGWFMDLYNTQNIVGVTDAQAAAGLNKGERQISRPILRNGRIVFTTLIPSTNPCEFGGTGWLMEVDAQGGSRSSIPVLDVNNDGVIDQNDIVATTLPGNPNLPASGVQSTVGILSTPAVLATTAGQENKYMGGSQGTTETQTELGASRVGRITWRELTP